MKQKRQKEKKKKSCFDELREYFNNTPQEKLDLEYFELNHFPELINYLKEIDFDEVRNVFTDGLGNLDVDDRCNMLAAFEKIIDKYFTKTDEDCSPIPVVISYAENWWNIIDLFGMHYELKNYDEMSRGEKIEYGFDREFSVLDLNVILDEIKSRILPELEEDYDRLKKAVENLEKESDTLC